jgi:hypothetical protein
MAEALEWVWKGVSGGDAVKWVSALALILFAAMVEFRARMTA